MIKRITAIAITCALLPLGCMLDETTHVLLLEADGTVTWRVLQDLLRSDRDAVRERLGEEDRFLEDADTGEDSWSTTLSGYGADEVDAWLLRDRRPYTLVVEGRFADLEQLTQAMIDEAEIDAEVTLVSRGDRVRYRIEVAPQDGDEDPEDVDEAWRWVANHVRMALAQGRFVEARGFDISKDGAVAVPRRLTEEEVDEFDGASVYELVWDRGA